MVRCSFSLPASLPPPERESALAFSGHHPRGAAHHRHHLGQEQLQQGRLAVHEVQVQLGLHDQIEEGTEDETQRRRTELAIEFAISYRVTMVFDTIFL